MTAEVRRLPKAVFIDPPSRDFLGDRLFDVSDSRLNRDGTLLPYARLKASFDQRGIAVHTADFMFEGRVEASNSHYWSLGIADNYKNISPSSSVELKGFLIMEPPVVAPHLYAMLPELTSAFETVYTHNIIGDGYQLEGVNASRLRQLYWQQPYDDAVERYWNQTDRQNRLVAIAGNHNPGRRRPEFYSRRIEAIAALVHADGIDLFGRGWERWWNRSSAWWPYWRHALSLRKAWRGPSGDKLLTLSAYRFSLCFENMPMAGYLTEKIFDCLYAGTVPVYLGAPDIDELIPAEAFVDMRNFDSYAEMLTFVQGMSHADWEDKRRVGREFLQTKGRALYYDSLLKIFDVEGCAL